MRAVSVFVSLLCAAVPLSSHAKTSLCQQAEEVLFSCNTGKRFISVCASGDLSAMNGYIKYRSGSAGKIELEYPRDNLHASKAFTFKPSWGVHGGTDALRFNIGEFTYIVWHSWDRAGDERGVTIKHQGMAVSRSLCNSYVMGDWSLDKEFARFKNAGVPEPMPEEGDVVF